MISKRKKVKKDKRRSKVSKEATHYPIPHPIPQEKQKKAHPPSTTDPPKIQTQVLVPRKHPQKPDKPAEKRLIPASCK
jgi:hypothetical protein